MAATVQANFNSLYWTSCSRRSLERYIGYVAYKIDAYNFTQSMQVFCVRFRGLYCLNDKPKTPSWPKYEQPYGMSWTMDEQCRQEFGEGFVQCKAVSHKLDIVQNSFCASKCKNACFLQFVGMDLCDMLWCSEGGEQYICKTKRSPPLPGTSCGYNKVQAR